jgi:hypothetical protein
MNEPASFEYEEALNEAQQQALRMKQEIVIEKIFPIDKR